ncbi:MAG: 16S rRNA processing protein RimM [Candidatus Coatesbacteria bacterium]|nr:16S rRNA processing protein RimM [Candidatus Coatesbacteria bacterium]
MEFIQIGKLGRTFGLEGALRLCPETDFPERFNSLKQVYLNKNHPPYLIRELKQNGDKFLISFENYDSPEKSQELVNSPVLVPLEERIPLPEGEHYLFEYEGMKVSDMNGKSYGFIKEAIEMTTCTTFIIFNESREFWLPYIDVAVIKEDFETNNMFINPLYLVEQE